MQFFVHDLKITLLYSRLFHKITCHSVPITDVCITRVLACSSHLTGTIHIHTAFDFWCAPLVIRIAQVYQEMR